LLRCFFEVLAKHDGDCGQSLHVARLPSETYAFSLSRNCRIFCLFLLETLMSIQKSDSPVKSPPIIVQIYLSITHSRRHRVCPEPI
jgi:hypothetical protein